MKATLLIARTAFLLLNLCISSQLSLAQDNAASLEKALKKADVLYNTNPQKAILQTKQLYQHALAGKFELQELKSVKLLVYFYWGTQDIKQAKTYLQQGIRQAKTYGIDSLCGDFYTLQGAFHQNENAYASAMQSYQQAITHYQKNKQQKNIVANWINLGICEMKLSNFERANRYYLKSAAVFDQLGDMSKLSSVYNSIGVCFSSLANPQKALDYHHKALALRRQLRDTALQAQSMNNIGLAFIDQQAADSALYYLKQCLQLRKSQKDSSILILTLQNIGTAYRQKGEQKKAASFLNRSLALALHYGRREDAAKAKLDLSELYLVSNQFSKAIEFARQASSTADSLALPELTMNAHMLTYRAYEQLGNHQQALIHYKQSVAIKDQLFSLAQNKRIAELEIQYQTVKKENYITALNIQNALQKKVVSQQRLSILALAASALLVSALLIVTYRSYRLKIKAKERIETLMHDLNHRVKNNLQILSGLFSLQIHELTDENAKNALRENEARLASMNLIHHKLYHNPSGTSIAMADYLGKLLAHINNAFGHGRSIELILSVEEVYLEADIAVAIGLIVNELTTNALKHAFQKEGGQIHLVFASTQPNNFLLKLSDNGVGITNQGGSNAGSFGLKLVHMLAKQLRSKLITQTGQGTTYEMEIKI